MTKQAKESTTSNAYAGMTPADIFIKHAGPAGEMGRGAVSKTIRAMHAENIPTGTIAKMLGKRYQHVRNVLSVPLKKQDQ